MEKVSRLCNLRPCEVDITKHFRPGKKCLNIYREPEFQNFTISGCIKYCGVCSDERCCIPYKSKTIEVEFDQSRWFSFFLEIHVDQRLLLQPLLQESK
ncbi:CCN family member 4-like [Carassius carassius]|uniref:CCN family member 4-like n=1 Tax=Carassius carassius TaxID=217509 RepID=UPI0028692DD8|nr:CCN family member 4-like [Carassius carassius]